MTEAATEDLEAFRRRVRQWFADHMDRLPPRTRPFMPHEDDGLAARALQRRLADAGLAGICYPTEYGGQSLTPAHQQVLTEESVPYEMPVILNVPSLSILGPTLLDFGTEEQKQRYLPPLIRGDEVWVQFLSEPTGGSDLAGLLTRATRDGDVFLLNGSKIWSSGAYRADYALCLARTNWHVPKHRGLTMFILPIHQPGVELRRIKMVNGVEEFCQEFFDDVAVPVANVLGQVDDGWTVATRLLVHERNAVGGGSAYVSGVHPGSRQAPRDDLIDLAREMGRADDPHVRQLIGESRAGMTVLHQLIGRVSQGVAAGHLPSPAGSLTRLFAAVNAERQTDIGLEIAGAEAGVWAGEAMPGLYGQRALLRQGASLAGGSSEMQRNIISERVLGMPREYASDRDRPFDEVTHNRAAERPR